MQQKSDILNKIMIKKMFFLQLNFLFSHNSELK